MALKSVTPKREEKWYRTQDFISNNDQRISKLTNNDDKDDVRWMGYSVVMEANMETGATAPRPVRFEIPAKDFKDAVSNFETSYHRHCAFLQEQNDEEEKKIAVPESPRIIEP